MFNANFLKNLTPKEKRFMLVAYSFSFLTFVFLFCNFIGLIPATIGQMAFIVSMGLSVLFLGFGNKTSNPENAKMFFGLAAMAGAFLIIRFVMLTFMG